MEELAKALAEAIKTGAAAAGPAIHSYFTFQLWQNVIAYGFPCVTILALGGLTAFIVNKVIDKVSYDKETNERVGEMHREYWNLRRQIDEIKSKIASK